MRNKLHFPGDHLQFDDRLLGPDRFGAFYEPTGADYDGATTTIFYRSLPPIELAERQAADWDAKAQKNFIRFIFGGVE